MPLLPPPSSLSLVDRTSRATCHRSFTATLTPLPFDGFSLNCGPIHSEITFCKAPKSTVTYTSSSSTSSFSFVTAVTSMCLLFFFWVHPSPSGVITYSKFHLIEIRPPPRPPRGVRSCSPQSNMGFPSVFFRMCAKPEGPEGPEVSQSPPCWFGNLSFPDATCARPRSNNRPLGDKDCGCDPIRHTNDSFLGIHLRFLCLFRCCPCRTTAECGEGHEHGQTLCTQIPGASQLDGTTLQENASQQKGR